MRVNFLLRLTGGENVPWRLGFQMMRGQAAFQFAAITVSIC